MSDRGDSVTLQRNNQYLITLSRYLRLIISWKRTGHLKNVANTDNMGSGDDDSTNDDIRVVYTSGTI